MLSWYLALTLTIVFFLPFCPASFNPSPAKALSWSSFSESTESVSPCGEAGCVFCRYSGDREIFIFSKGQGDVYIYNYIFSQNSHSDIWYIQSLFLEIWDWNHYWLPILSQSSSQFNVYTVKSVYYLLISDIKLSKLRSHQKFQPFSWNSLARALQGRNCKLLRVTVDVSYLWGRIVSLSCPKGEISHVTTQITRVCLE